MVESVKAYHVVMNPFNLFVKNYVNISTEIKKQPPFENKFPMKINK